MTDLEIFDADSAANAQYAGELLPNGEGIYTDEDKLFDELFAKEMKASGLPFGGATGQSGSRTTDLPDCANVATANTSGAEGAGQDETDADGAGDTANPDVAAGDTSKDAEQYETAGTTTEEKKSLWKRLFGKGRDKK